MSKKSRRRNKKLLAMLAVAGGAAMAGRGKGPVKDVVRPGSNPSLEMLGETFHQKQPLVPDRIKSSIRPSIPKRKVWTGKQSGDLSQGMFYEPMYKKGGRVTGAAKRGFGRALMKGKK